MLVTESGRECVDSCKTQARVDAPQRLSRRSSFLPTESGAAIAGVRNWKNEVLPASVERSYQYRSKFLNLPLKKALR